MADLDDVPGGGGTQGKKKATPAGKYKAMVKKPAQDTSQMLMVEKADGSGSMGKRYTCGKKASVSNKTGS